MCYRAAIILYLDGQSWSVTFNEIKFTCFGANVLCLSFAIIDLPPLDHVSTMAFT